LVLVFQNRYFAKDGTMIQSAEAKENVKMQLFADLTQTQIIFIGVVVVTTFFLLMRTSRYFTRPKAPEPSWSSVGRKSRDSEVRSTSVPQEMAGWEVEMHEFVREIKAELDSKMRALQAMTADADRAADRLEAALKGSPNSTFLPGNSPRENFYRKDETSAVPKKSPSFSPASAALREPRPSEIENPVLRFPEVAGRGKQGIDLGNLPSSQVESLSPAGVPHPEHSSAQTKKEEIYTLADYGMKPAEIASRVGHPIGEVELILSLRGKR
jgi:hypothetical protein